MNRQELIKQVSKRSNLTQKDCAQMLKAFTDIIGQALKSGEEVKVMGFGRFYTKHLSERNGYNPLTGQKTRLKGAYIPSFKCSAQLKRII
ncbi:MAG: HU family DNA-binding protein [Firmicutes bacterium]|nr:HU family DNA-binding protein [Bacillota bacterium]